MTFDLENPKPKSGDVLRDEAANLLKVKYRSVETEHRQNGKKIDIYFKHEEYGKVIRLYVEAKDYSKPLTRPQVVAIWSDYSGIIDKNKPSCLLLITRQGLTADAQAFVQDEQSDMRHQTIWELENSVLGLTEYVRSLTTLFDENNLSSYYVSARADKVSYGKDNELFTEAFSIDIFQEIEEWLRNDDYKPKAILGGYGAGKTSLARRVASSLANEALKNPLARRPVVIKLGAFTRYSDLTGLLAGLFTSEFPVDSFNVQHFLKQNAQGKLCIILDGFDEMKHAMTWADFHAQLSELNRLISGKSKVLLLGRPSAFISLDEHYHVLRGKKKFGNDWRKIPNWPEFNEYVLLPFKPEERSEFVTKYLAAINTDWEKDKCTARASEVNKLADLEHEIFSKPVHAKILTDLAADHSVDLKKFSSGISRWDLYNLFFESLAERETTKEARREIGEQGRRIFLREIAYWLWKDRGGLTSFHAIDIPSQLIQRLYFKVGAEEEAIKREYLTGASLEKKSGDAYFFAHRSFAEFLVAERMVNNPPSPSQHHIYSMLAKDGVASFLIEPINKDKIAGWVDTLGDAIGQLHIEYIKLLADSVGGCTKLASRIPEHSVWHTIANVFPDDIKFDEVSLRNISKGLRSTDNLQFSLMLFLFQLQCASAPEEMRSSMFCLIAAAVLSRVFTGCDFDGYQGHVFSVPQEGFKCKALLEGCLLGSVNKYDQVTLRLNGDQLLDFQNRTVIENGVGIQAHPPVTLFNLAGEHNLKWEKVKVYLSSDVSNVAYRYFRVNPKHRRIFTQERKSIIQCKSN